MYNNNLTFRKVLVLGHNNTIGARVQPEQVDEDQLTREWIGKYAAPVEFAAKFPEEHFAPGLRDRVMSKKKFTACLNMESQTFVLVGKAGIGKTTTVQGIINYLNEDGGEDKVLVASMFYNWYLIDKLEREGHHQFSREAHEPSKVMMRLLIQVVDQYPRSSKFVRQFYRDNQPGCPPAGKTAGILTAILSEAKKHGRRACIVIDGVDECKENKNLTTVLRHIGQIQEKTGIGVLLTDRLREGSLWRPHFRQTLYVHEEDRADEQDIESYIKNRLADSVIQDVLENHQSLLTEIIRVVKVASGGIFLLAHLNVEHIISQEAKTEAEVRNDLNTISSDIQSRGDLDNVFIGWLERIASDKDQKHGSRVARRVFRYVRDAVRPLTVPELRHAITWDLDRKVLDGPAREWDDIRRVCMGLIETDDSGAVRFYHQSLRLSSEDEKIKSKLPKSHAELGNICMQYLSQEIFSSGACANKNDRGKRLDDYPLLPYASRYWSRHFDAVFREELDTAEPGQAKRFDDDALQFLRSDSKVEFSLQMARYEDMLLATWSRTLQTFPEADATMFHELPISRIAVGLFDQLQGNIEESEDFDPFVACRTTGLHLACRHGFLDLVSRLLKGKACECKDRQHRTPLHIAAAFNQVAIVEALLSHDVDPDPRDKFGYSPLMSAAQNGAVEVVTLLLEAGKKVDINAQTTSRCSIYKRSALHIAASKGHLKVAQALLTDPSINVDLRDSHGETPLHLAVKMRNLEMLKCFVNSERKRFDVHSRVLCHSKPQDITSCGFCGCNVLHLACLDKNGKELVQYLLKHFPGLRTAHDHGERIPLHYAVSMEAIENVELLLEEAARDQINAMDQQGWPPLVEAIRSRNAELFAKLWDHPDFKRSMPGPDGTTFLEYAEKSGNDEILSIIRDRSPAPSRQPTHERGNAPVLDMKARNGAEKTRETPSPSALSESPLQSPSSSQITPTKETSSNTPRKGSFSAMLKRKSTGPEPSSGPGSSSRSRKSPARKSVG